MSEIHKLIKEYQDENCNFNNIDWVISASLRMSTYRPTSQSDCFLYTLANEVKKQQARIAELEAHLREIRDTAKLVSTTSRMKSVRQGYELSGAPMHYIVPLYLVNGISSLLEASDE